MSKTLAKKDVVVIGFGWTGAIIAKELTEAGLKKVKAFADGIGPFQRAHIVGPQKMVMYGFSVIPHNYLPTRSVSLCL